MESRRGRRACPKGLRRKQNRSSGGFVDRQHAQLPTGAASPPHGKDTLTLSLLPTCLPPGFSWEGSLASLLCIVTPGVPSPVDATISLPLPLGPG